MERVFAVLFLCAAVLLFVIALLGARNPLHPRWASDFLIANVHAVAVLALIFWGVLRLAQYGLRSPRPPVEGWHLAAAAGATAGTAVIVKALRVRRRVAAWRAQGAVGTVVTLPGSPDRQPPEKPRRRKLAA